jgi:hypothetical protein
MHAHENVCGQQFSGVAKHIDGPGPVMKHAIAGAHGKLRHACIHVGFLWWANLMLWLCMPYIICNIDTNKAR